MWSYYRHLIAWVALLVVVSACSAGPSDDRAGLEGTGSPATTSVSSAVSTTSSESTPSFNSGLPQAAVDLAVSLECVSAEPAEFHLVETSATIACRNSRHGTQLDILLFDSLQQTERYLEYFQTGQIVGSDTWLVTGTFDDIDSTAETLGGITVIREKLGKQTARAPTASEAYVLFDEAVRYAKAGAVRYALTIFDQIFRSIPSESDPELLPIRAAALLADGTTYRNMGMFERAVKGYQEMIDTYGASSNTEAHGMSAEAMFWSGIALGTLERYTESIEMFDAAVTQAQSNPDAKFAWIGADAMYNKAIAFNLFGDPDTAIGTMQQLVETYADMDDATIRDIVNDAQRAIDEQS
jgi:tetratricopeptide (TPR) repeat protein